MYHEHELNAVITEYPDYNEPMKTSADVIRAMEGADALAVCGIIMDKYFEVCRMEAQKADIENGWQAVTPSDYSNIGYAYIFHVAITSARAVMRMLDDRMHTRRGEFIHNLRMDVIREIGDGADIVQEALAAVLAVADNSACDLHDISYYGRVEAYRAINAYLDRQKAYFKFNFLTEYAVLTACELGKVDGDYHDRYFADITMLIDMITEKLPARSNKPKIRSTLFMLGYGYNRAAIAAALAVAPCRITEYINHVVKICRHDADIAAYIADMLD